MQYYTFQYNVIVCIHCELTGNVCKTQKLNSLISIFVYIYTGMREMSFIIYELRPYLCII